MADQSLSGSASFFKVEELRQIRTRFKELKKEKDTLTESQVQSFQLIRRLELHVKTLSESSIEDKNRIDELEGVLRYCFQEIEYLQEQLNTRNMQVVSLSDNVQCLEKEVDKLSAEMNISCSNCFLLMQDLECKEKELQSTILCIEKLEESISSTVLEYQCEIEGMRLDLMTLEQSHFELKKIHEETAQENRKLNELIQDFELQIKGAEKSIKCLETQNKDLRVKQKISEANVKAFFQKMEEQIQDLPGNKDAHLSSCDVGKNISVCGNILGPLLSRVVAFKASDANMKDKLEKLTQQIYEYDHLVKQLKEELREEKLKAKDEAEELAQEMAEFWFQITELLEEERKRRACIEQLSLHRIAELEAQVENERRKSFDDEQRKSLVALRDK